MKKLLTAALLLLVTTVAQAQTLAFPGAEGFGRFTTGGRGGQVYHVTSLEDNNGQNTLRYGVERSGARIIVFDVSGTIHLRRELKISKGDITIAGQTAPGDGICVADYPFVIAADNVIIRFMRFRLGNKKVADHEGDGLGGLDNTNVIIDHCSISWSIDECLSLLGQTNSTVQWCIAGQSLREAGHEKGAHGYGGNWGGSGITYHHNLLAHHESRMPRLGPRPKTQLDERMDMRNNVFYNWAGQGCYGGEAMTVNIVNNYYKPGPATDTRDLGIRKRIAGIGIRTSSYVETYPAYKDALHIWGKLYVDGNVNADYDDVTNDNWSFGIYNQIDKNSNDGLYNETVADTIHLRKPMTFAPVVTHSAAEAYERVLTYAGASLHRDALDDLLVSDTRNRRGSYTGSNSATSKLPGIIDSQNDVAAAISGSESPWPTLTSTAAPADTDGDGMPDEWETANGLNPNDAADGAQVAADGYTNLEHYMNSLVAHIMEAESEGATLLTDQEEFDHSGEPRNYTLSSETVNSEPGATTWTFNGGFSISTEGVGCANGNTPTIKFSRNKTYTINIPEGLAVTRVDFFGYCNGNGQTSYIKQLGNKEFSPTDYVFPARDGNPNRATHTITLDQPATGALPFVPSGDNQSCFSLRLTCVVGDGTGISELSVTDAGRSATGTAPVAIYNAQGCRQPELTTGLNIIRYADGSARKVVVK